MTPSIADMKEIIHIIDVKEATGGNLLHIYQDDEHQNGVGFFAP